jgi:tetratricopeptide (TPR) repeat protein
LKTLLTILFSGLIAVASATETATNSVLLDTSKTPQPPPVKPPTPEEYQARLEQSRAMRLKREFAPAEKKARELMADAVPAETRRLAMLELAFIAQDAMEFAKAQQVFGEYARRYPKDPSLPEVLLRQGMLYREMGAHTQAEAKFYAVMTAALNLNLDRMEYYQALVLKAQTEIAETYLLQGKYTEAGDYFARLLKLDSKNLDRPRCLFKMIRCLAAKGDHDKTVAQAQSFLTLYPDSLDVPEVRFIIADSLKKLDRNTESMRQVLALLESQQSRAASHPELWSYWQQKTGNEIANQLYKEGDYMSALEIYLGLAKLNSSAGWQLPVWYQIGLVYEHLKQPAKAIEMYSQIVSRTEEVRTNSATPGMLTLLEMAQWRRGYLGWTEKTDKLVRDLTPPARAITGETAPRASL